MNIQMVMGFLKVVSNVASESSKKTNIRGPLTNVLWYIFWKIFTTYICICIFKKFIDLFFSMKFLYFHHFFQLVILSITDVCLSALNYFNTLSIGTETLGISCCYLVFYSE